MLKYFTLRFLSIFPMLLLISVLVFGGLEMTPGDPLSYMLPPDVGVNLNDPNVQALRKALGLDAPVYVRYVRWLGNLLTGNLGYSVVDGSSIRDILATRIPATLELAFAALLVSSFFGILLGLVAAINQNSFADYFSSVIGVIGISIPDFFFGICLIQIFSIKLGWFPIGGRTVYGADSFWARLPNLVLPALTLGIAMTAALLRYTRASMLDVLGRDYIKTARSKGIPEWKVYIVHAFRNALMPVMLILCFRLPMLLGGSVIIETVFGWPGMGQVMLQAVSGKDYPVAMITTLLVASLILFASFLVDLFTALLDPRIRFD